MKAFNVKDGLGIKLLINAGIRLCILTGRSSNALRKRCSDLGIDFVLDGIGNKADMLDVILDNTGLAVEEVAFMGDDLPDLALMKMVGLSIAVADAHERVRRTADMVTSAKGGAGAVREICEAILSAKGLWEDILDRFS